MLVLVFALFVLVLLLLLLVAVAVAVGCDGFCGGVDFFLGLLSLAAAIEAAASTACKRSASSSNTLSVPVYG